MIECQHAQILQKALAHCCTLILPKQPWLERLPGASDGTFPRSDGQATHTAGYTFDTRRPRRHLTMSATWRLLALAWSAVRLPCRWLARGLRARCLNERRPSRLGASMRCGGWRHGP